MSLNPYHFKARAYANYRWDYAPQAIQAIVEACRLTGTETAVDLGAGTGILTRHLPPYTKRVFAFEPGWAMLCQAVKSNSPKTLFAAAVAEAVPLPNQSVDLITAAQAVHWFQPQLALAEMQRILKPEGWLVLLKNQNQPHPIQEKLSKILTAAYGVHFYESTHNQNINLYFQPDTQQTETFPFQFKQDWAGFLGSLHSASFTPTPDHPLYPRFKNAVHDIFLSYAADGVLVQYTRTELTIGKLLR